MPEIAKRDTVYSVNKVIPRANLESAPKNDFPSLPRIPSLCTGLLNRLSDVYWERKLRIVTAQHRDVTHPDAQRYESLPYSTYFKIFDRLALKPYDVVADLGCGKGRVLCIAATQPIKEVIGIEIDSELTEIARANAVEMRNRRAPIRLLCQSAAEYDFSGVTTIFIFNPFGAATMRQVLSRMKQSWEANPRTMRIIYANAVHTHLLAAERWLKLEECWTPTTWSRVKLPVHFYRTPAKLDHDRAMA